VLAQQGRRSPDGENGRVIVGERPVNNRTAGIQPKALPNPGVQPTRASRSRVRLTPNVSRHHYDQVYFHAEAVMLTRQKIIELLQAKYPYLAAEFGVSKIGLLGSYIKGQPNETSDIDIIVEFGRPIGFRFFELVDYLEELLGHRVDVLTPAGIQNIRIKRVAQNIVESVVYV
jgi:predicted nucleotidyltransferase